MTWTLVLVASGLLLVAGLWLWWLGRPRPVESNPISLVPSTPRPPGDMPSSGHLSASRLSASRVSVAPKSHPPLPNPTPSILSEPPLLRLFQDDDDDDLELTSVTVGPPSDSSMASGEAAAVPILYDDDAAVDEPTGVTAMILVSAVGQTDRGQRRRRNEDSYLVLPEYNLFVIADGMGGHAGGEVASRLAVETMERAFRQQVFEGNPYPNVPRRGSDLAQSIQMANRVIYDASRRDSALSDMGTTVVGTLFSPNKQRLYVGHVGDSRCYRLRQRELRQLTTDHTMAAVGMVSGPFAAHLHRAVGIAPTVKVDLIIAKPRPLDVYVLCSDGLSKMVSDDEIRDILMGERNLQRATDRLVSRANDVGGRDNITVVLIEVRSPTDPILGR
ncbi:MAG TPA: PP2C family serine/threonine-protein phosphatase [Polyangiaceae bacterium]|nr:PP2C family serine/threonine-protein phosphatase [Polyangiaceae bacterium]